MIATMISRHRRYLLCLAWVAFVFLFLFLFRRWDYGHGRERFLILIAVLLGAWDFRRLARAGVRDPSLDIRWGKAACVVYFVGATLLSILAGTLFVQGYRRHAIPSDQAQGISRAIELFLRFKANPYGRAIMLQPADLSYDLDEFEEQECGSGAATRAWLRTAWYDGGRALLSPVIPASPGDAVCNAIVRRLHTMGFRYGPVLLAFYAPFVATLWEAGILLAHAALVLIGLCALTTTVERKTGSLFAAAAVGALLVWTRPMRWEIFIQGHSDLLPTALAMAFYFLHRDDRPMLAAVAIGLSIGAKPLPGLLWVPLLSRQPRALAVALLVAVAGFLPFIWWDAGALWGNISYPFLNRYTDSTAVAHYLAPGGRRILSVAGIGACGIFGWRWLWTGKAAAELDYLLVAHVAVLAVGSVFHNNYLVWLMPVMALVLIEPFLNDSISPINAPRPSAS